MAKPLVPMLVLLLLIFAPSNLFLVLCDGCGYINGLQSDYLLPKLYLVDLLMAAFVLWTWLIMKWWPANFSITASRHWPSTTKWGLLVIALLGVRQLWATFPLVAIWNFAQWGLLCATGYSLFQAYQRKIVSQLTIVSGLTLGLVLQTLVGGYQFIYQKPLFSYAILGETDISRGVGIPMLNFSGQALRAPYGTTAHPNILAGFIAIYSLMLITWLLEHQTSRVVKGGLALVLASSWVVVGLTQSLSGAAVLVTGGIVVGVTQRRMVRRKAKDWWQWVMICMVALMLLIGLITPWIPNQAKSTYSSLHRRQYLLQTSWQMVKDQWLWGSGLSNFTATAETYSPTKEVVRFNQPVHHVGWLWLAETGLVGLVVIGLGLWRNKTNAQKCRFISLLLILLLPVLIWDHYLLSLENGKVLLLILCVQQTFVKKF
jgi:hypothetical protein